MTDPIHNPFGPYFTEAELSAQDATPEQKDKLLLLVRYVLEPIRKRFGSLIITSGFRSAAYNEELKLRDYKPSPTSQHCLGEAVDFICHKAKMYDIYSWTYDNIKVGELFYYSKKGHIHVSLPNYKLVKAGKCDKAILDE